MIIANKIQNFLQENLEKNNLKRKDFAQKSNIPYPTVNKLINAIQLNPDLSTILKIAIYFDCTIDEVINRTDYYIDSKKYKFKSVSLDIINNNLKVFIHKQLEKNKLSIYKLGKNIGLSEFAIFRFIKKNNIKKTLSTEVIIALADYFEISIDEMIGRVSSAPNQELQQNVEKRITTKP